jgi:hypothetical protein
MRAAVSALWATAFLTFGIFGHYHPFLSHPQLREVGEVSRALVAPLTVAGGACLALEVVFTISAVAALAGRRNGLLVVMALAAAHVVSVAAVFLSA